MAFLACKKIKDRHQKINCEMNHLNCLGVPNTQNLLYIKDTLFLIKKYM